MAWRLSLIPCQGFPQHKSTMVGDYCFSKWVTRSVDEKHLKHTFSAVVWTGPGKLAPRPRRSRKRPLPGLCYFSSRAWKVRFFCKTLPSALSTLQEMFPIVSQTHFFAGGTNWKKIRSLFKCRKHWASDLKMRSVVFDNSRYVRDIECTSQIEASKSPLPRATFGAFEFLENFCLNSRLPGPKSCSNAPS